MAKDVSDPGAGKTPTLDIATPAAPDRAVSEAEAPQVAKPVASVLVDSGLPHLDRFFEYAVPPELDEAARPGVRVKVRFAGQDLPGFVVERRARAEHPGRLAPVRTVVSPEPVLTAPILALARELAAMYAGTPGDVLRLAIPPRHARAEKALPLEPPGLDPFVGAQPWESFVGDYGGIDDRGVGFEMLTQLRKGRGGRWAACLAPAAGDPDLDWPAALAQTAAQVLQSGRGTIIVVPDHRDVDRLDAAVKVVLGPGRHVRLTADQGPQARYTSWLKVLRGHVQVVIGTRAAAYAPVADLGLIAVWDDGDDLHEEPRAPYVHTRDVAATRARLEDASLLLAGYGRSVADQSLVEAGWLESMGPGRRWLREVAPRVVVAGAEREQERDPAAQSARLPNLAWRTAKSALERGPVLIQVPRRGYVPSLACQECRTHARCLACGGPLGLDGGSGPPVCRWCASVARAWRCPHCEGTRLRSLVVGARRTAEELGRALPGVPVLTSGAGTVLSHVPNRPALVIATPGAEPVAEGGYAAALLLDAWALLDRVALDAAPEALRRWMAAAALVRAAAQEGTVVVCGAPLDQPAPAVQALVRWDAPWLARRELAERRQAQLPPAMIFAEAVGPRKVLEQIAARADLPAGVARFGPVPKAASAAPAVPAGARAAAPATVRAAAGEGEAAYRLLLRAQPADADAMATALRAVRAERSARKEPDSLRIRVGLTDPD